MPITAAVFTALKGDATLAGLLTEYPASSGVAAVFTTRPIPEDAVLPFIVTAGNLIDQPFDTKGTTYGREIQRDIGCYAVETGSAVAIEAIAERVRTVLHKQALVIAGFTHVVSEILDMIPVDEDDVVGRILTLRVLLDQ